MRTISRVFEGAAFTVKAVTPMPDRTITVKVNLSRRFRIRLHLGLFFLKIAKRLLGCKIVVSKTQEV